MAPTPRQMYRPQIPTNATRSSRFANRLDRKNAPPLGLRRVFVQVAQDLYGTKDVQDAITASYVWMADQIGHITLGLVPTLLLCWLVTAFDLPSIWRVSLFLLAGALIFSYWVYKERTDYVDTEGRAKKIFPLDSADLLWNVKTALLYFAVGGILAIGAFSAWWWMLIALAVLVYPALAVAFWWLRRKLAFQQAGLPYLYRLANFAGVLGDGVADTIGELANVKNHKVLFWRVLLGRDPVPNTMPIIRHVLVTGPLRSGKTSLAVGIGTEFAFALGIGRYLTAAKLVQLAAAVPVAPGEMERDDGRVLWPWRDCDLLIVDDVDAGFSPPLDGAATVPLHLVRPADFVAALTAGGSGRSLDWLGRRRSVWVLGDPTGASAWRQAIAELMAVGEESIMPVELGHLIPADPPAPTPIGGARRIAGCVAGAIGLVLLLVSAGWWNGEAGWGRYQDLSPEQAFVDGSFGLELAPLKYILVADTISATALRLPGGPSWVSRFGFLPRGETGRCAADAPANLPVGFSVSNLLPGSAAPVPVRFVGLTCALCHSAAINGKTIIGVGSQIADVIGFTDAFLNAALDPRLSADKILDAYAKQCPNDAAGFPRRQIEVFLIDSWLDALRNQARDNATKYDLPFHGDQIGGPANIPTGPSRTRPFRSVVRNTLDFPSADNHAYSKVPLAAMQIDKPWSQFDGSIGDPTVRSMIAVFTSGASIPALNERQIADNVRKAAGYTLRLGQDPKLPSLRDVFPSVPPPLEGDRERGGAIYMAHCDGCHGHPADTGWVIPTAREMPQITPLNDIGTDPARLSFRYAEMLPAALATTLPARDIGPQVALQQAQFDAAMKAGDLAQADWWRQDTDKLAIRSRAFPRGHRLFFPSTEVALRHGYLNAPLPFAWLRAPYLHNASVPTLSALIGLTARPDRFCRGDLGYDPSEIGVKVREPEGPGHDRCPERAPFLFDTAQPGNSNGGHNYPPASVGTEDRQALLAYLGTL